MAAAPPPAPGRPDAQISTQLLTRIVILLIAVWSTFAGLVLLAFHGVSAGALGAGVTDQAGQRLVGAHMLVLVPAYLFIAWRFDRYHGLLWLPFAGQAAVMMVVGYGILTGETEFGDGILALVIGAIFVALLGFLWITEQRTVARLKFEADLQTGPAARGGTAAQPPPARQPSGPGQSQPL